MSEKKIFQMHADVCKALAHAIRIQIIDLIGEGVLGYGEILKKTNVPKSSLSQHLAVMVERGILIHWKEGLHSYYRLSTPKVAEACRLMREVLIERLEKTNEVLKQIKD